MKELALQNAVDMQRRAVQWAKARGASPEVVEALQSTLERILGECARVGRGPVCACGAVLAEHNIDGKRVDEHRDGHGMLWGVDELCAGFSSAEAKR